MEELLIILLQGFFELLVNTIGYWPCDWPWSHRDDRSDASVPYAFLLMITGAVIGGIMNFVHPGVILPFAWARIAGLGLIPLLNGAISYRIARWRLERSQVNVYPARHFWYAASFSLGFVVIRFAYGLHS